MLIANKLVARGHGLAPALLKRASTLELGWDLRQKSRFDARDSQGDPVAVFLPRGSVLRGGDVLIAEDGSLRRVLAAKQPVLVVTHCAEHGSRFDLLRAAYHLGNRHVALELQPDRLQLEPDHVLADLLRAMHLIVTPADAAFEPEAGAYAAGGHAHGHGHEHGQEPALEHAPAHEPAHDPATATKAPRGRPVGIAVAAAPAAHVHGPGCGHDHSHG